MEFNTLDVLKSLILEANPNLSDEQVAWLANKYYHSLEFEPTIEVIP